MNRHLKLCSIASLLLTLALAAGLALPPPASAASVALATAPLATSTTSTVKPNIMFILDDSGSMNWDFLPDWADQNYCKDTSGTYGLACCSSVGTGNGSGKGANAEADACWGGATNSTAPFGTYRGHPPFMSNAFNGVFYNPSVNYAPPVLYNTDGTLNTTTYPSQTGQTAATGADASAKPNWKAVKNDGYNIQNTNSINLVSGFPDVEWCTDGTFTDCLRNDNYILPGVVGGKTYKTYHATVATGTGNVATGSPAAADATTAARTFGPHYYTIVPGEFCDAPNLKNCQTTETATFKYAAPVRWCNSNALTTCQALNSSTFNFARYPTTFFTPAVAFSPAVPAVPEVIGVTGVAASASFTFTFSGSLNPVGFSIKVNGTEMLTSATPAALKTSSTLAAWVAANSAKAGYTITSSGSTVTITATTTGTAKNINTVVITETPPVSVTFTTSPGAVSGVTGVTGSAPTSNGTLVFTAVGDNKNISLQCGGTFVGSNGVFASSSNNTPSTRLNALFNTFNGSTNNGYTMTCTKSPNTNAPTSVSCSVAAPVGVSACSGGFTVDPDITTTTNTGPSGGTNAVAAVKAAGTLTFTNATSLNPTGFSVKVDGTEIMTATTPNALQTSTQMASFVKNNSALANYTITSSGAVVTITANTAGPTGNITTIAVTQNAPSTATASAPVYVAGVNAVTAVPGQPAIPEIPAQPAIYYGYFMRTDIVPGNNSYPYPGTATKPASRTDCAGTTCTYVEEMTNFANWWAYYHTRMQSMKTSVSRAFKTLDNRFRVGFSTITYTGATNGSTFLGNNTFELAHKNSWFTKVFGTTTPNSTALRGALSKAGRYYAKKISGQVDPVQYSCQQNFTILSTDGYWNDSATAALDLSGTQLGNMDGSGTARPMYEGPTAASPTLADIAKYYYETDLRTSALSNCAGAVSADFPTGNPDVCTNNVFVSSTDNNTKQHMTTFTMGLGADGTLNYTSDYATATSGDFYDLKNGLGSPTVNWPNPIANDKGERIDDLWHAAVNGQGLYFSAKDPDQIIAGLNTALSSITAKLGSAAAAATSTLNPVAGNNFAYVASYTTVKWIGNLEARTINTSNGVVSQNASWCVENVPAASCVAPGVVETDTSGSSTVYNCVVSGATAASCSAPGVFDSGASKCRTEIQNACTGTMGAKVGATTDTRTIYTANSAGNGLVAFDAAFAAANPSYFDAAHINSLNQWGLLDATQRTAAAANLINFLRGQNGYEDRGANAAANRLYRAREAVMGDALESQPAFIGKPVFNYPYAGYSDFKTAKAGRAGTVYIGTNDGMMHAFDSSNGIERWSYVPSMVIPNMWKLASTSYSTAHVNFANGSAITSDVFCPGNCGGATDGALSASWRTILVAGLNGGGRGYYALDITEPATPVLLWEFTTTAGIGRIKDDNLGYTFGQPVITRKADGTWVVMVTSGYNNTSPGDGRGYLYVLDASTGAIISKISTGTGDTTTPSGLAKITGWNDEPGGNKVGFVYGGDLLGNLWRFNINSAASAVIGSGEALKFATLFSDAAGAFAQPIMTAPALGKISDKRVVFIGTGKYLESGDLTTTQKQTQYAIKDDNATATLVNARNSLVQQFLVDDPGGAATRLSSGSTTAGTDVNPVNFLTGRGWFVDLPDGGSGGEGSERVNIDSKLIEGTLIVPTIVPSSTVCSPGGFGWLNFFNYETGGAVVTGNTGTGQSSAKYDSTIVGVNVIYIGGVPITEVVTSTNPTPEKDPNVKFKATVAGFTGKRVIWRELMQ